MSGITQSGSISKCLECSLFSTKWDKLTISVNKRRLPLIYVMSLEIPYLISNYHLCEFLTLTFPQGVDLILRHTNSQR